MPPASPYENREFRNSVVEMAKSGVIPIVGRFDDEMVEVVTHAMVVAKDSLLKSRREWVTLLIDSPGGYVSALNSLRAAMLETGLKFKGSVQSQAYSCAFMLLQYCNYRAALSNSNILFHYGWAGMHNTDLTLVVEDVEWSIRHHKMRLDQWVSDVSARSGLSKETIHDLAKYEKFILAQRALEMGLLDEVVNIVPKTEKPPL